MRLEVRELVKHYVSGDGETVRAVDRVCLSVDAGELVALYGPSGSGKSTLLAMITGLLRPDAGSVLLDGRDVLALSDSEQARYRLRDVGLLDHRAMLLPGGTALQNAAMKLWMLEGTRAAERRVTALLEDLGLGARLTQRAESLSMGERQRVALARALSTEPKLVLADEPTGSLDSARGREVLQLLARRCAEQGTAALLVTHDPQATAFADRVLTLRDGRIVAPGPESPSRSGSALGASAVRLRNVPHLGA